MLVSLPLFWNGFFVPWWFSLRKLVLQQTTIKSVWFAISGNLLVRLYHNDRTAIMSVLFQMPCPCYNKTLVGGLVIDKKSYLLHPKLIPFVRIRHLSLNCATLLFALSCMSIVRYPCPHVTMMTHKGNWAKGFDACICSGEFRALSDVMESARGTVLVCV